jgi:predicted nucleotidyltransferase
MTGAEPSRLPVEQIRALRDLYSLATGLNLAGSLVVVGATARLLQLDWPCRLPPRRTTTDVDLVLQVRDWPEYRALMDRALAGGFHPEREEHRLRHRDRGTQIDLVPYG